MANNKYLDLTGLSSFWTKIKKYIDDSDNSIKVKITDTAQYIDVTPNGTDSREFTIDDSGLVTKIGALETADSNNAKAITDEVDRAKKAEGDLDKAIKDEVTNRGNAISALKGDAGTDYDTLGKLEDAIQKVAGDLNEALGNGGNVAGQITAAIEGLDVTDSAVAGEYVSSVSETDGKISVSRAKLPVVNVTGPSTGHVTVASETIENVTNVVISTDDIASAQDLTNLTGRVSANETAISALASATHYLGVKESLTDVVDPKAGDVVVIVRTAAGTAETGYNNKEYIFDDAKGWIELGDTTGELASINALKDRVDVLQGEATVAGSVKKTVADAIAQEVSDRNDAIAAVKVSATGSTLVSASADATGRVITLTDTDKLTSAVALAETSVQGVTGSESDLITIGVTGDANKTIGATLVVADNVAAGEAKLTTADKVKSYVESVMKSGVVTAGTAKDADVTKVATGIVNKEDGTYEVEFTNFTPITSADITGTLFTGLE